MWYYVDKWSMAEPITSNNPVLDLSNLINPNTPLCEPVTNFIKQKGILQQETDSKPDLDL